MNRYDIIIIGGGISGLSLAHYSAKAGLKALVLEKKPLSGGCLCTHGLPSGFYLELGAHTCYNSYANLIGIMEDLGLKPMPRVKVPFRLITEGGIKSIVSELDLLELLLSAPRMLTEKKAGQTVESYYSKIVGMKNYRRVFTHILSAVPSQRADDFPAGMLFKRRQKRKDWLKKFTFAGGLQKITDAIGASEGITLLTGIDVKAVGFEGDIFTVRTADRSFASGCLALAVPPPAGAALIKETFPELAARLSLISAVAVDSVGVVVKKEKVSGIKPFAGLIPLRDGFYSIVSRDTVPDVSDTQYRGFTFHFRGGIDYETKIKRIREFLGTDFEDVASNSAVLPSPVLGHERLAGEIEKSVEGKRLLVTGNYFTGLAIEDCVSRSLGEFNRLKGLL